MKIFRLSIILAAEGWRKTITEIDATESNVNYIFRMESGHRRLLKKHQLLEVEFPIRPSHERIGMRLYCLSGQIGEAERIINSEMTSTINRIRDEYTAMMDQVARQPSGWIRYDEFPMPASGKLHLG